VVGKTCLSKEKIVMNEFTPLKKKSDRLHNSLRASIQHFREGNDQLGWDNFQNSMEDLQNLLEFEQYFGDLNYDIPKITTDLQALYVCLQNKDIIGMTDVLEFTLFPLANQWVIERDGK